MITRTSREKRSRFRALRVSGGRHARRNRKEVRAMDVGPQETKGLSKILGTVRQGVETGQDAASTAVSVIIDTIANGPAALIRGDTASSVIGSELHVTGTLMCTGD